MLTLCYHHFALLQLFNGRLPPHPFYLTPVPVPRPLSSLLSPSELTRSLAPLGVDHQEPFIIHSVHTLISICCTPMFASEFTHTPPTLSSTLSASSQPLRKTPPCCPSLIFPLTLRRWHYQFCMNPKLEFNSYERALNLVLVASSITFRSYVRDL